MVKFDMFKIYLFTLFLFLCSITFGQSHYNEKRIYLLDVTASMIGKGIDNTPNIFELVKEKLTYAISNIQDQNTDITIIPFTNKAHSVITGNIKEKQKLIDEINKIKIEKGDTNLSDAWLRGLQEIDSTKINYIFLLTDGLHNYGVEKEILYKQLQGWEEFSRDKYFFAFYVMLTPHAKEIEITKIIDETNKMWLIESMDVSVSFLTTSINLTTNVNQQKNVKVRFASNNNFLKNSNIDFDILIDENPYYILDNLSINRDLQYVSFDLKELKPRIEIPLEYSTKLHIRYDRTKYPLCFFTPDIINFNIINKGVRTMNIREK